MKHFEHFRMAKLAEKEAGKINKRINEVFQRWFQLLEGS